MLLNVDFWAETCRKAIIKQGAGNCCVYLYRVKIVVKQEFYEFVLDTDAVGSNLKVHIFHKAIDFVIFVSIISPTLTNVCKTVALSTVLNMLHIRSTSWTERPPGTNSDQI